MTAQELASNIDQFVKEHGNDREVMSVLGELKAVRRSLARISGAQDTSKPTPGRQAATRSGGNAFPPKQGATANAS
jgi:hypothetical protein